MGTEKSVCVNDLEVGRRMVCWEDGEKAVWLDVRKRGQGNKTSKEWVRARTNTALQFKLRMFSSVLDRCKIIEGFQLGTERTRIGFSAPGWGWRV